MEKRQLEAYAVARWCDLRRRSKNRFSKDILAVGDFNLPIAEPGDPIFDPDQTRPETPRSRHSGSGDKRCW